MKKQIKSYLVFTSFGIKISAFFLIPLAVFGVTIGSCLLGSALGFSLGVILIPFCEIILDALMFGGICAKEVEHLEYLKCSPKGKNVIFSALLWQLIRCFLTVFLLILGSYMICRKSLFQPIFERKSIEGILLLILSEYFFIVLGDTVQRFLDDLQIAYLISGVVLVGALVSAMYAMKFPMLGSALLGSLSILVSIVNVKVAYKRIQSSYYDSKNEEKGGSEEC